MATKEPTTKITNRELTSLMFHFKRRAIDLKHAELGAVLKEIEKKYFITKKDK